MKRPTSFIIGDTEWVIKYESDYHKRKNLDGEVDFDSQTVYIQKPNKKFNRDSAMSTLVHELLHVLFMEASREDLCYDEKLVLKLEPIAYQILKSLK